MNLTDKLPEEFRERVHQISGAHAESILQSYCDPHVVSVRINTLKTTTKEVFAFLQQANIPYQVVPWYPNALLLPETPKRQLSELEIYKHGHIYIQSLSSMIPPLLLNPQPGETVLDIAAAPGSKTSQIAMMMQNTGEIVANDISRTRIFKMKANLEMLGVTNVTTRNMPGERIWQQYPHYFDRVLVDAHCSMEGMFRCDDPASYEHWSVKKVKQIAKQQRWLLRSAISSCKPGGIVVYSTCTLSPEENEGVIDWIIEKERGKISVVPVETCISPQATDTFPFVQALTEWNSKTFHPDVQHTRRVLPSTTMIGFYVAVIQKKPQEGETA